MIALGIDPGRSDGALAILDTRRPVAVVLQALAWSISKRKHGDVMRVWTLFGGESTNHPAIFLGAGIGPLIRTAGADRAAWGRVARPG